MAAITSIYGLDRLILPPMTSFGRAIRRLRGKRTGPMVAAAALGEESSSQARRDFANYLSKIEHDRVPNVGLGQITLLAKGLGLMPLSRLFDAIEFAQHNEHADLESLVLKSRNESGRSGDLPQRRGDARDAPSAPVPQGPDPDELRREIIHEIAVTLFNASAHVTGQPSTPDAARPGRRSKSQRARR